MGIAPVDSSRNLVLSEVLRNPNIARSEIADRLGLNLASVSRISRELIEAGLIRETEIKEDQKGPGRRLIGLSVDGGGGYIVGIGLNAFRQSVTLANLANEKISEWISETPPGPDGAAFLRLCLHNAEAMIAEHVPDRTRFFGVGVAVAANLDLEDGVILDAAAFGWTAAIPLRAMVTDMLGAPLVLGTPSVAINQSEAEFGFGLGVDQVATLHCSLGFGLGVRKSGAQGEPAVDFGRVLIDARSADPAQNRLDELCGGIAVLNAFHGTEQIKTLTATERGKMLVALIATSVDDSNLRDTLRKMGELTAQHLSLVFDVLRPDLLLLAGPLAQSEVYVTGFREALHDCLVGSGPVPRIGVSEMTPTGASRWLALRGNVALGRLNLADLKQRKAA